MVHSAEVDLADVLLKRGECLSALVNRPRPKPELVEALDIPRSTLDDVVRDLERANLAEYCDGQWQPTLLGQYTLNHHTRYKEGLKSLTDATPVIKKLPQDTPIGRRFLIGAEVHVPTASVPDAIMQILFKNIESATHVRGITPLAMAGYADSFYQAATTGSNAQLEVVLPLETFDQLRTLQPDSTNKAMANDDIALYHANVPAAFSLWIADDDHAGVIVYADQGVQGILINETDDALNWAADQYDRIRKDADPIFYDGSANPDAESADVPD